MKVLTVVGARPQFIKAAVVSRELDALDSIEEVIVHTGQHFDRNMSEVFFKELGIPEPKINLGVSGGSHAQMTGSMLVGLERAMLEERPDMVLLYGDTNSTLAGALAAVKLQVPICHVEAGGRTFHLSNPEEVNRICTDHVSSIACAVTASCMENLEKEGLEDVAVFTGDPMYDAFLYYKDMLPEAKLDPLTGFDGKSVEVPAEYCYLTCHRQENTEESKLRELLLAMDEVGLPVIYPVHPRMQHMILDFKEEGLGENVRFVQPVGYLESIALVSGASFIATDSGGLQREAFFAEKKCVTLMDFVVVPETMRDGRNVLSRMAKDDILASIDREQRIDSSYQPFGDGKASEKIAQAIVDFARSE